MLALGSLKKMVLISRLLTGLCLLPLPYIAGAQGHDRLVYLETWGAPWETRFDVSILEDAQLSVVVKKDGNSRTVRVKLSTTEVATLYEIANRAVLENRITDCEKVMDGTSGRLTVKIGGKFESRECLNTKIWPPSGTVGAELVRKINAKLPKNVQVF